jgi:hypothetical protein
MFKFGVFLVSNKGTKVELFNECYDIADAREKLAYQLNRLANNENQATANVKDGFHFFVKNEGYNYANEKQAFFISRIYQGKKQRFITANTATETAAEKFYFDADELYFNHESLKHAY